jgi:putative GTP pyrophosphokinase
MAGSAAVREDIQLIVDRYRSLRPVYDGFAGKLGNLVRDMLDANDVKYQIVESRAKEVSSFEEKISRPGKAYAEPLSDITDLCGCRIIVYYEDDVDRVSQIIKSEFTISEENLSRQPQILEVDRFGYLSAHYIVSVGSMRTDLIEWKPYAGLMAEIQVRTVIQHAWSAVSHALQYKQEAGIPSKLQRRLHRIAGLFELADEEFVGIRKEREALRLQVRRDLEQGEDRVPLTAASLSEFLSTWGGGNKLLAKAEQIGFKIAAEEDDEFISTTYDVAILAGINDLGSLRATLEQSDGGYFGRLWKENGESPWLVNESFLILLMLIYNAKDRITVKFLVSRDFDPAVARVVTKAFGEKPLKASKTRK